MMKLKDFDLSSLLVLELKLERCNVKPNKTKTVEVKAEAAVPPAEDAPQANDDVCWGCLEEGDLSDMHKPFNEHDDSYADLIAYCFSLKVAEDAKSNKRRYYMCSSCIVRLQEAVKFRRQLEVAQSFFNNLFPDQPEESKHDPEIDGSLLVPMSFTHFSEDDMTVDEASLDSLQPPLHPPLHPNMRNQAGHLYKMLGTDVTHVQAFSKAMDEVETHQGCRCPFCKEVFPTIVARRRHMRQTYGGRIAKYTCEECGKPFGANSHLNCHVRNLHLKEHSYKCDFCQKSFFRRRCYVLHMHKHTGVYQCPSCNYVFATPADMSKHRSHCTALTENHTYVNPNVQAYNQNSISPNVQEYNQNSISPNVQAYNQNSISPNVQSYNQDYVDPNVQALNQDYVGPNVQAYNQDYIGPNVMMNNQSSMSSDIQANNQDYVGPNVQAYNQDYVGADVHSNDSNSYSEPEVSSIACVTPIVMTAASSSSGGTYFIINHDQYQV